MKCFQCKIAQSFYGLLYINSTIENSLRDEDKALIAKLVSSIKEKAQIILTMAQKFEQENKEIFNKCPVETDVAELTAPPEFFKLVNSKDSLKKSLSEFIDSAIIKVKEKFLSNEEATANAPKELKQLINLIESESKKVSSDGYGSNDSIQTPDGDIFFNMKKPSGELN